jgi:wyosine [tRNA(Phe)-imidazoG37] synthetase (radical SAM superfamily)
MTRWLEELSQYDITLKHRPGSKSGNADSLSRRPCPQNCTYCSRRENREQEVHVNNVRIQTEINWEEEQSKDQDISKMVKLKIEGQKPLMGTCFRRFPCAEETLERMGYVDHGRWCFEACLL